MTDESKQDPKNTQDPKPNEPNGTPSDEQKAKRLEKEVADLQEQLAEAKKNTEEFQKKLDDALTEEDVKKAVEAAKEEAAKIQTDAAAKAAAREKRLVVENELIKANCIDTTSALAHIDLDKVEIASDGHISGLDVSGLAESHKHLFEQSNTSRVASAGTPGGNGKKMTKEEIMSIKDPIDRQEKWAEMLESESEGD